MSNPTSITKQHENHTEWLNKLLFYKDDLIVMQHHLDKNLKKIIEKDLVKSVEHFKNEFSKQAKQIDILKHGNNVNETLFGKLVTDVTVDTNKSKILNHYEHTKKIEEFEIASNTLRKEFMTFLVKCM